MMVENSYASSARRSSVTDHQSTPKSSNKKPQPPRRSLLVESKRRASMRDLTDKERLSLRGSSAGNPFSRSSLLVSIEKTKSSQSMRNLSDKQKLHLRGSMVANQRRKSAGDLNLVEESSKLKEKVQVIGSMVADRRSRRKSAGDLELRSSLEESSNDKTPNDRRTSFSNRESFKLAAGMDQRGMISFQRIDTQNNQIEKRTSSSSATKRRTNSDKSKGGSRASSSFSPPSSAAPGGGAMTSNEELLLKKRKPQKRLIGSKPILTNDGIIRTKERRTSASREINAVVDRLLSPKNSKAFRDLKKQMSLGNLDISSGSDSFDGRSSDFVRAA